MAPQCVGDLLHGERVGRRAGADPQQIDLCGEGRFDMGGGRRFGRDIHARLAFYALQPRDARRAYALEASRFGAGFPESGAEDADPFGGQLPGAGEHLFFGLGAARTGDDERAAAFDARQQGGGGVVHGSRYQRVGLGYAAYSPRMRNSLVSGRAAATAWR